MVPQNCMDEGSLDGGSWVFHCCPAKEVPWLQKAFVSMKGDWSPVRAPGRGRGLFTVAAQALPGHLPLSQAPAIRPSAVTTLASISLGGRGPVLGQRASWKGRVPHCCPGAWLPSPGGGRTFRIIAGQFLAPQADTMGKTWEGGHHCF